MASTSAGLSTHAPGRNDLALQRIEHALAQLRFQKARDGGFLQVIFVT
jgi:hypothetical protein